MTESTYTHPTIRELPNELRPVTRMSYTGPAALSDSETLSIILGSGRKGANAVRLAETILVRFGGLAGIAQASDEELRAIAGIGPTKAAQMRASIELGKRLMGSRMADTVTVRSPADVANLLMLEMSLLEQEELRVLVLNTKNALIKTVTVYKGSLNTAVARVGEVFREAVRANAASIVALHNHPSGDPTPSPEDVRLTEMLVEAGKLLDIAVLDHIILGRNRFVSLKERGLGFSRL
jgi:DNA repair protein RadC